MKLPLLFQIRIMFLTITVNLPHLSFHLLYNVPRTPVQEFYGNQPVNFAVWFSWNQTSGIDWNRLKFGAVWSCSVIPYFKPRFLVWEPAKSETIGTTSSHKDDDQLLSTKNCWAYLLSQRALWLSVSSNTYASFILFTTKIESRIRSKQSLSIPDKRMSYHLLNNRTKIPYYIWNNAVCRKRKRSTQLQSTTIRLQKSRKCSSLLSALYDTSSQ